MSGRTHDVLVVGGGHNGLTAACYLAARGVDVAVIEAAETIGGMTASGTPVPEAPHHVVNYCAADLLFWESSPVERELRLAGHGLRKVRVDPSYVYLHPDGASIAVWQDPRRTADEIRRFSPADAEAYLDYARFLDALFDLAFPFMQAHPRRPRARSIMDLAKGAFRHRRLLKEFGAFLLASGEETIEHRFEHPVTRALLYCLAAGANPITTAGTSVTHLFLAFLHRNGTARPVGGMQAVPDALAARLKSLGGTVLTGSPVAEIVVTGGRARGLRLADGRELHARKGVLATCDPATALGTLLPAGTLPSTLESRVRHIPSSSSGAGAMKADLALSGRVRLGRHERWRGDGLDLRVPAALIGTPEGIRRTWVRAGAGLIPDPDDVALWPVVLNAADPSQAPEGQDSLYLFATAMPLVPDEGWASAETKAADVVVERAAQFYDGVTELEIGRWVETPELAARRTGATNGTAMHVDHLLLSQGPLRPALGFGGIAQPVDGLYLGGAGAHPGGGVSGLAGRLAARTMLRDKEIRRGTHNEEAAGTP